MIVGLLAELEIGAGGLVAQRLLSTLARGGECGE